MGFYIEELPTEFNGITMQEADYLADEFLKDTPCNRMWDAMRALRDFYETVTSEAVDMADRKTENSSEKPNNCEYAKNPSGDVWECGCFLDTYCEHQIYDRNPDGTINIVECGYEPKDEPQTCEECEHWNDTEDGCADRHGCKTENSSEIPNNCETCKFEIYWPEMCEGCCEWDSHYEPKDEPQTERSE